MAHVVLGLIPLMLAPVIAWLMIGQVVPRPKAMNGFFSLTGLSTEPGLPPQASRDHSDKSRWKLTEGFTHERSLCGLNLPKWRGEGCLSVLVDLP